jgi:phage baseplate assembly protein W
MGILQKIQIAPESAATIPQDVVRCLYVLFNSRVGELALDRDFGIDWSFVDLPIHLAKMRITMELTTKMKKYETRCDLKEIQFETNDLSGDLVATVFLK